MKLKQDPETWVKRPSDWVHDNFGPLFGTPIWGPYVFFFFLIPRGCMIFCPERMHDSFSVVLYYKSIRVVSHQCHITPGPHWSPTKENWSRLRARSCLNLLIQLHNLWKLCFLKTLKLLQKSIICVHFIRKPKQFVNKFDLKPMCPVLISYCPSVFLFSYSSVLLSYCPNV